MPIVTAGNHEVVQISPGQTLRVTADADSTGEIYLMGESFGEECQSTATLTGATLQYGPYYESARFDLSPTTGSFEYTIQPSVPLTQTKVDLI